MTFSNHDIKTVEVSLKITRSLSIVNSVSHINIIMSNDIFNENKKGKAKHPLKTKIKNFLNGFILDSKQLILKLYSVH